MEIKKVKKNKLNLMSLFSDEVEKAYEEGIYCDSPANRKLGRVGMTYKEWSQKQNEKEKDEKKDKHGNDGEDNKDKGDKRLKYVKSEIKLSPKQENLLYKIENKIN